MARVTVTGTIATGYATNLFQNAPVAITADGSLIIAVAGTTNRLIGSFQGVEYIDATGKPVSANYWPASTAATRAGSTRHAPQVMACLRAARGTCWTTRAAGAWPCMPWKASRSSRLWV